MLALQVALLVSGSEDTFVLKFQEIIALIRQVNYKFLFISTEIKYSQHKQAVISLGENKYPGGE